MRNNEAKNSGVQLETILRSNRTSASFLMDYVKMRASNSSVEEKGEELERVALVFDLYIKARSYAMLNKVGFFAAMVFAVGILVWPSVAIILNDFDVNIRFFSSAVLQTTITGLAALAFALYTHYKKRQTFTESLMRYAIFSGEKPAKLQATLTDEMSRIDQGFSFSRTLPHSGLVSEEEPMTQPKGQNPATEG